MPTASQHAGKVVRNRAFLATIDPAAHPEWAVTVAFYSAIHSVEQFRHHRGDGNSADHGDRQDYVPRRAAAIRTPFTGLKRASSLARHEPVADFFQQFSADDVRDTVLAAWLVAVETYVAAEIAQLDLNP